MEDDLRGVAAHVCPAPATEGPGTGARIDAGAAGEGLSVPRSKLADMSRISRDQVDHLAMLARIDLTDDESEQLTGDLAVILDSLAQIREAAADDVPAMSHPQPLVNVMRPDEVRPGLSSQEALEGAPAAEDQRFVVPRILAED